MSVEIRRHRRGSFLLSEIQLAIPQLPEALDGFRIVQLSDLHYGLTGRRRVEEEVRHTNELSPDLIALTGDYLEYTAHTLRARMRTKPTPRSESRRHVAAVRRLAAELGEILGTLRATESIVAVHGNHEFIEGVRRIRAHMPPTIRWLVNEAISVDRSGAKIAIAGIDDVRKGTPNIPRALEAVHADAAVLASRISPSRPAFA